jgi:predicted phosphohydrolase
MQRIVWTSDNHLDRMDESERREFMEHLGKLEPDGFIIAGDIGEADSVTDFLKDFHDTLSCPIYFVLGNHDFWGSNFEGVRSAIRNLVSEYSNLHWLSESGVISLNSTTALIGHEGWADARLGKIGLTGTVPRDFMMIEDLKILQRSKFESALNDLGDAAADYIRGVLLEAVAKHKDVFLVTHVPPFKEASLDRSRRICDDQRLPFYSCKAIGDVLIEIMSQNPECKLTVLSGHMHEKCEVDILPNLQVKVLDAGYGTWYPTGTLNV